MVIFLHGDDTYRSRQKLRELKEKFLREVDPSGANLAVIDGTTVGASDIWGAIAAQSFLVRKRMVVIEDIGAQKSKTAREEIVAFLDRVPNDVIVVFWESKSRAPLLEAKARPTKKTRVKTKKSVDDSPAKDDQLFTRLLKEKYAQEFAPLDGVKLGAWIRERVKELGATIAPAAQQMLIQEVGSDLWRMSNELEKLVVGLTGLPIPSPDAPVGTSRSPSPREGEKNNSFPTSSSGARSRVLEGQEGGLGGVAVITADHVRDLVSETPPDTIFAFIDAVSSGDRAVALQRLRELEAAGAEPQVVASMLTRQFRLRLAAADLIARGVSVAELAPQLGVKPFVAQKLIQQVRGADIEVLRAQFIRLVELDRELKSSRAPWQVLVELFCLDVTMAG